MNDTSPSPDSSTRRLAITVRGVVQGVGFRPFVYNAARRRKLAGWVRNEAGAVRIEMQGDRAAVEAFLGDLRDRHPPQARIDSIDVEEISPLPIEEGLGVRASEVARQSSIINQQSAIPNPQSLIPNPTSTSPHPSPLPRGEETVSFEILHSEGQSLPRPTIPADLATCPDCLAEIRDPSQRRYNYPFTNCTNCGPRWSIIEQLPYDRPRTAMASFAMCPECQAEYDDPADRRFHAQPIACPRCGPSLQLLDRKGRETAAGQAALDAAVQLLLAGKVLALKGLGGFQLLADAANAESVALLRQRKRRPDRPFAVMAASLDDARRYCEISATEAQILSSHQAPIVLLRRKPADVCHCLEQAAPPRQLSPSTACAKQWHASAALETTHSPPGPQFGGVSFSSLPSPLSSLPSPRSPVPGVAPGNPYLGMMLPNTPLHHLLLAAVARPLVCTSGNLSEEPMAITIEDALRRLGPIADAILTHNRPIVRPVDDSIVRVGPDGSQVLRRARGFAPLPIELQPGRAGCQPVPENAVDNNDNNVTGQVGNLSYNSVGNPSYSSPTILAVGGHLKNTVALSLGTASSTHPTQVVMSAHVGDLDSVLSVEVFRRAIDDLVSFFQAAPEAVVCDLHPDYASTRHAQRLAAQWDVPLVRVQHHHAHVASCMAEHGLQGPVLGFAWDGTGYGLDGTVWGGETLWCAGAEFQRAAHLRTFALPGGDAAVREPRRSALGLLFELFGQQAADYTVDWFAPNELTTLLSMLSRGINSPRTSSMGRLFDAVAALCGLPPVISFEGQAAMSLEYAADADLQESYNFTVGQVANLSYVLDWEPLVRGVLADRAAGVPVPIISARFHNALAEMAVAVAQSIVGQVANLSYVPAIVLSGGCFQNALLASRVRSRLSAAGFPVYTHQKVPPGDGGISLGQLFLALQQV